MEVSISNVSVEGPSKSLPVRIVFLFFAILFIAVFSSFAFANPEISESEDGSTVIVHNAPEQDVYVFGKAVIVKRQAKGVLAIGGDVTVEGRVEGDVATIGGNVIQEENAYIGGDVIVFGGSYKPKSQLPLREEGTETVMFGVLEDEIKGYVQQPSTLFSPVFSASYFVQRIVVALLWFIVSLVVMTIAPGAVSRSVSKIQLSPLRICAIGAAGFLLGLVVMIMAAVWLPTSLFATVSAMVILLFLFGYLFGRVSLQVAVGKIIQKRFFPANNRSETLAVLSGVLFWTILLSLPYIWMLALFTIFAVGIGLVMTARPESKLAASGSASVVRQPIA